MSSEDRSYLEAFASCTQAQQMNYDVDNWKPIDGLYTVVVEKVDGGVKKEDGKNGVWQKAFFKIIAGDASMLGRSFSDYFYIDLTQSEIEMSTRQQCRLATCLAGREIFDSLEAATIIADSAGQGLQLEVRTNVSKKNGKSYQNTYYKNTVATEDAPAS